MILGNIRSQEETGRTYTLYRQIHFDNRSVNAIIKHFAWMLNDYDFIIFYISNRRNIDMPA